MARVEVVLLFEGVGCFLHANRMGDELLVVLVPLGSLATRHSKRVPVTVVEWLLQVVVLCLRKTTTITTRQVHYLKHLQAVKVSLLDTEIISCLQFGCGWGRSRRACGGDGGLLAAF